MNEYMIPGYGLLNEEAARQFYVPGFGLVMVAGGAPTPIVKIINE